VSLIPQILLSINLPTRQAVAKDCVQARDTIRDHLLRELVKNGFAATWIVHDHRLQDTYELLQQTDSAQEFSMFVDTTNNSTQRKALNSQLADLMERTRKIGVRITTLSTNQRIAESNLNILVRNKISLVNYFCGTRRNWRSVKSLEPSSLRFGIWEVPAPLQWAQQLSNPVRELILKSVIRFKSKHLFQHVQIDIQSMLENKTPITKFAKLLQALHRIRERGRIDVTPVRSSAALLRHLQMRQPTRLPAA
jgi:hypothetical protein|tara:strand:+ start:2366 stop:3118 length:753 start_codon:yes stop_codon:yes gene_type:complete